MKQSFKLSLLSAFLFINGISYAQPNSNPGSGNTAPHITATASNNPPSVTFQFEIQNIPNLTPQPPGFYTYLWWMGDNGFSFLASPQYEFQRSFASGNISQLALTTGNYSTGGPPPLAYSLTPGNGTTTPIDVIPSGQSILLQNFRNPVANDDMYFIFSYTVPDNMPNNIYSGTLEFDVPQYANIDDNFINNHPELMPNDENYLGNGVWEFKLLEPREERSILIPVSIDPNSEETLTFKATTSFKEYPVEETEEGITQSTLNLFMAESHDPNQMIENSEALNQCNYGGEPIQYTVKFQNTGDAPTDSVIVTCRLDEKLDLRSIRQIEIPDVYNGQINASQPMPLRANYFVDSSAHSITFKFDGLILLPIEHPATTNLNYTREEVSFTINLLPNYIFGDSIFSQTDIIFDENDPITTNLAKTYCADPLPMNNGGGFFEPEPTTKDPTLSNTTIFVVVGSILLIALLITGIRRRKR